MVVTVMDVAHVIVCMDERLVSMRMAVRFAGGVSSVVAVLVMIVVAVHVLVFEECVAMLMGVSLS